MQNAEAPPLESQGPRIGLSVAFGVSVLLHALLLTLGWWLPAASQARATPEKPVPRPEVLQFTFAPPPTEIATANPPPQPPSRVRSQPPRLPPPAVAPTGPQAPPGDQRPPGGQTGRDEPSSAAESEGSIESDQTRNDVPPDRPDERGRPRPPLDLGRAVRDFGETLDQVPRATRRGSGTSTFVPDAGQFPTTGYGLGNLAFETRDFDWSDYGRQIYIAIWRAWHNRLYQTVDDFEKWAYGSGWFLNHENRIRFVIERSGQVTGITVEADSGCGPLDASATQALAEVILPPLPDDFPKDREVVRARFLAEGSIQEMRPSLTRLKRLGLF